MSNTIQPILKFTQGQKAVKVAITIASGVKQGTATVPGINTVDQIISAYIIGTGQTAAAGFATDLFIQPPNTIGASVNATSLGNITVEAWVQGY